MYTLNAVNSALISSPVRYCGEACRYVALYDVLTWFSDGVGVFVVAEGYFAVINVDRIESLVDDAIRELSCLSRIPILATATQEKKVR